MSIYIHPQIRKGTISFTVKDLGYADQRKFSIDEKKFIEKHFCMEDVSKYQLTVASNTR